MFPSHSNDMNKKVISEQHVENNSNLINMDSEMVKLANVISFIDSACKDEKNYRLIVEYINNINFSGRTIDMITSNLNILEQNMNTTMFFDAPHHVILYESIENSLGRKNVFYMTTKIGEEVKFNNITEYANACGKTLYPINIAESYKQYMNYFSKRYFDCFARGPNYNYKGNHISLCRLNFYIWILRFNVIGFIKRYIIVNQHSSLKKHLFYKIRDMTNYASIIPHEAVLLKTTKNYIPKCTHTKKLNTGRIEINTPNIKDSDNVKSQNVFNHNKTIFDIIEKSNLKNNESKSNIPEHLIISLSTYNCLKSIHADDILIAPNKNLYFTINPKQNRISHIDYIYVADDKLPIS